MRLAEARVLVTGASGGIGSETALLLARRGADVTVHGRDRGRLAAVAQRAGARTILADLADPDGPAELVRKAGPVEVLVSCAGVGLRAPLPCCDVDRLDRMFAVNLRAPMMLARAFVPAMAAAGHGHLAFIASVAGRTGVAREAAYAASKAGVLMFAESLALELSGSGVEVSTVSPGAVDTGFWVARGAAYHRSVPRPVGAARVARQVVRGIEAGGGDRTVPAWLAAAPALRTLAPRLHRRLTIRMDPA